MHSRQPSASLERDLDAALWRLLAASDRVDPPPSPGSTTKSPTLLAAATDPRGSAWRHAFDARRALIDADADAATEAVGAAREALGGCPPSARTALTLAYLAHVEATADHVDAAMLLAVDASLLAEASAPGARPRRSSRRTSGCR